MENCKCGRMAVGYWMIMRPVTQQPDAVLALCESCKNRLDAELIRDIGSCAPFLHAVKPADVADYRAAYDMNEKHIAEMDN